MGPPLARIKADDDDIFGDAGTDYVCELPKVCICHVSSLSVLVQWVHFRLLGWLAASPKQCQTLGFSTERAATLELGSLFRYITKRPMGRLPRRALTLERMQTSMRTCLPCPRSTEHQVGKSALFVGTQRMCCASDHIPPMLTT